MFEAEFSEGECHQENCLSSAKLGYEAGGRPSISPKFNFSLYPKYSHYASVLEQNVVKFHQEYNGILPRYVTCDCHVFVTFFVTYLGYREKLNQRQSFIFM